MLSMLHRRVLQIAVPMILSNLTVPLLGMVDTGVVGHLSDAAYLGAVAVGSTLFNFLYLGLNFLRMGTTGVTAQVHGREDGDAMRGALGQSVLLALGLATLLLLCQWPLRQLGLALIGPSADVHRFAAVYFDIRIWSAPAVLVNYALLGWFLGMQNARLPLLLMLVINLANIGLDLGFVLGLGMTVDGVALASVISEYLGTAVGLWSMWRMLGQYPGRWCREELLDRTKLRRLAGINANIFIRTICLVSAFAFFTSQGARQGDLILAANAVLLTFQTFMSYGLDGFAHATEALAGRAIGRGDATEFRRVLRACLQWSGGLALIYSLGYALAGVGLIHLLTDLATVRASAERFLPWMVLSPLISVWPFFYDGVFIGATRAREMRNAMLFSLLACYLPAWYLLRPFGNHGLWAAL
ncbi:MAG: MATE family efflux transporter, partial [Gammaproteobacteria bacterium]